MAYSKWHGWSWYIMHTLHTRPFVYFSILVVDHHTQLLYSFFCHEMYFKWKKNGTAKWREKKKTQRRIISALPQKKRWFNADTKILIQRQVNRIFSVYFCLYFLLLLFFLCLCLHFVPFWCICAGIHFQWGQPTKKKKNNTNGISVFFLSFYMDSLQCFPISIFLLLIFAYLSATGYVSVWYVQYIFHILSTAVMYCSVHTTTSFVAAIVAIYIISFYLPKTFPIFFFQLLEHMKIIPNWNEIYRYEAMHACAYEYSVHYLYAFHRCIHCVQFTYVL